MAKFYLIVKYVFLAATVLSAGFVIERLTVIEYLPKSDKLVRENLTYNASIPLEFGNSSDTSLQEQYMKCILEPTKPFCLVPVNKRLQLFRNENPETSPNIEIIESRFDNMTLDRQEEEHNMHRLLVDFLRLMESGGVKAILIEPSAHFCLLSSGEKFNELKRGVHPGRMLGSRNVVTFAVLEKDSERLRKENLTSALLSAGFSILKVKKWIKAWDSTEDTKKKYLETFHYLFIREETAVHLVVFHRRNSYLWHAGLNADEIDFEGLLFINDQVFEKFTLLPLNLTSANISQIFIPSNIRYFLGEVESSRFLECQLNSSVVEQADKYSFSMEQIKVAIALRELKTTLAPHAVIFWLWSKTFSGWFETCNILHYSSTLQLSLTLKSIEGLNFTRLFSDNKFLEIESYTNLDPNFVYHLNCHGLLIEIYVMHDEKEKLWCKYNDGQNIYRLTYPAFELCSTDIFGQKVSVPCKGDIFSLESKQNWTDPDAHSVII